MSDTTESHRGHIRTAAAPVEIILGDLGRGLLLLCDHASNAIPPEYGNLGLPSEHLGRHIAYDIGAAAVTRACASSLGVPALLTTFSRLLIDPNRGLDDPTLIVTVSDGTLVPGNTHVNPSEVERRVRRFYEPYNAAIATTLDAFAGAGVVPAILSIHSMTPTMQGVTRPWHASVLWDADPRLAMPLLAALRSEPDLIVGDNEPYGEALRDDTLDRHAAPRGLAAAVLELRQDLVHREIKAAAWGRHLAGLVAPILEDPGLRIPQRYRSRAGVAASRR
jgi:predicted N-formylglutamate amidohydrolase